MKQNLVQTDKQTNKQTNKQTHKAGYRVAPQLKRKCMVQLNKLFLLKEISFEHPISSGTQKMAIFHGF